MSCKSVHFKMELNKEINIPYQSLSVGNFYGKFMTGTEPVLNEPK